MVIPALENRDVVVFDIDGTLHDSVHLSLAIIRDALHDRRHLFDETGTSLPKDAEIMGAIGEPADRFYRMLLPDSMHHHADTFHREISRVEVEGIYQGKARLFPGVQETLAALASGGFTIAACSNASKPYYDAVMDLLGLDPHMADRICHGDHPGLDKGDLLSMLLDRMTDAGKPPMRQRAVMVGDRIHDLEAARSAGVPFIGATYGFGPPDELSSADAHIHRIEELTEVLMGRASQTPSLV